MKKIIVCGCSWMTPDLRPEFAGTHFSELLAKELDYELVVFSRPGSSNGGICVQLEQAIKERPDLILFGQTVADRVEIRITDEVWEGSSNPYYDEPVALSDLIGQYASNPTILSDNLHSLLVHTIEHHVKDKTTSWYKERLESINSWFNLLYSPKMKRQIDTWCLYAVQHKIYESKIPAIKVIDLLDYDSPWFNSCTGNVYKPSIYIAPDNSATYHTDIQIQKNILNTIKNYIEKNQLIQ